MTGDGDSGARATGDGPEAAPDSTPGTGGPPVRRVRPTTPPEHIDLNWIDIDSSDLHRRPTLLMDLVEKRYDGATVHGIYSDDECQAVLERLPLDRWQEHFIGRTVGMAVGMITDEEPDRERYLRQVVEDQAKILHGFGFDPHARLAERLAPAAEDRPLLPVSEDGRFYNPGHLRYWEPGLEGLKAHVGNEFWRALAGTGMRHMVTTTAVKDDLSYFVVLQRADVGGEFSVYDLVWDQDDASGDARVDLRDDSRFDTMPCLRLNPGPGDLIIFGGGWRWHRVEPPTGERARVTYGGFCAPSLDSTQFHFWA